MLSTDFLKISGGYFHDCGIHDVDIICWIMGEVPDTVFCLAHAFHSHIAEMDDVDTVGVIMRFPSGAIGQIDQSREAVYGDDHRIEVFGSGGMLTSDNQNTLASTHFHSTGSSKPPIKFSFPQRYSQAFDLEMNHFIDVMNNRGFKSLRTGNFCFPPDNSSLSDSLSGQGLFALVVIKQF